MSGDEEHQWRMLAMAEGFRGVFFAMIDSKITQIEQEILETCPPEKLLEMRAQRLALRGIKSDAEERIKRATTPSRK